MHEKNIQPFSVPFHYYSMYQKAFYLHKDLNEGGRTEVKILLWFVLSSIVIFVLFYHRNISFSDLRNWLFGLDGSTL